MVDNISISYLLPLQELPLNILQLCRMAVLCMMQKNLKRLHFGLLELSGCQFFIEKGWGILQTRRYIAKMKTTCMFKFNMGILLDYSFDILPSTRKIISQYNIHVRNKDQFNFPKCRLDIIYFLLI